MLTENSPLNICRLGCFTMGALALMLVLGSSPVYADRKVSVTGNNHYLIFISGWQCGRVAQGEAKSDNRCYPRHDWKAFRDALLMPDRNSDEDTGASDAVAESVFADVIRSIAFGATDLPDDATQNGPDQSTPNSDTEHLDDHFLYYSYTGQWEDASFYEPDYTHGDTHFHDNHQLGEMACPANKTALVWDLFRQQGGQDRFDQRADHLNLMINTTIQRDPSATFTIVGHSQGAAIAMYWAGSDRSASARSRINAIVTLHGFTKGKVAWGIASSTVFAKEIVNTIIKGVNHIPVYSIQHQSDRAAVSDNKLEGTWLFTWLKAKDTYDPSYFHSLAKSHPAAARAVAAVIASNTIGYPDKPLPLAAGPNDNPLRWLGTDRGFLSDRIWNAAKVPLSITPYLVDDVFWPWQNKGPDDYFGFSIDSSVVETVKVETHKPDKTQKDEVLANDADLEWRWEVKVKPPKQATGGLKPISTSSNQNAHRETTFGQPGYVLYSGDLPPTTGVDLIAVIDRSGSMGQGNKLEQAKEAAILLLNQPIDSDQIGVVSFDDSTNVSFPLSPATGSNKSTAEAAILRLSPGNRTSIGGGLRLAQDELQNRGDANNADIFVLLSDGIENEPPYWANVKQDILNANIAIYTVGLGADADLALLQEIANSTGGTFNQAPTPEQLLQIYSEIAGNIQGKQTFQVTQGNVPPSASQEYMAQIDTATKQVQFQLTWSSMSTSLDLALLTPSGQIINATNHTNFDGVTYRRSTTFVIYDIENPEPGAWKYTVINPSTMVMDVRGAQVTRSMEEVDFTVNVNGVSDLQINNISDRLTSFNQYEPVTFGVDLFDPEPILDADVTATIRKPNGEEVRVSLESESLESTMVFPGEYIAEYVPDILGVYTIRINAIGQSNDGSQFERTQLFSVFVESNSQPPADLEVSVVQVPETDKSHAEYCIAYGNSGFVDAENAYMYLIQDHGSVDGGSLGVPVSKGSGIYEWNLGRIVSESEVVTKIRIDSQTPITQHTVYAAINDDITLENSFDPNFDTSTTPTYDPYLSNNGALSSENDLDLSLTAGWHLVALARDFSMATPSAILCPMVGQIDVILGYNGEGLTYDPDLPDFSTLNSFAPLFGYWIRASTDVQLTVPGASMASNEPIRLKKGWNLVAYLPDSALPVVDALSSIAGKYDKVLGFDQGAMSYYTDLPPELGTLQQLEPNMGIWIHMLENDTLQYPVDSNVQGAISVAENFGQDTPGIPTTDQWLNTYSTNSTYNGRPLPAGSIITAIGEDGRALGEITTRENGLYGVLAVYHDDAYTPELDGARTGERIRFRINGQPATITNGADPTWTANGDLIQVDLAASGPEMNNFIYLPSVQR